MSFSHENLAVYKRALTFNTSVSVWLADWDSIHAICDHLPRAAQSVLENIAMSSATYSRMKIKSLDYALGSTLECAGCLDIARIKGLMDEAVAVTQKQELSQLLKMLIGLRRTWASNVVQEDKCRYGEDQVLFHHERLDVYKVALAVVERLASSATVQQLSSSVYRRLDSLTTSMVLNIAEGNGRYSELDQSRFLGTSHEATVKLAARLDLCVAQGLVPTEEIIEIKKLLSRISAMTSAMISKTASQSEIDKARDKARDKVQTADKNTVGFARKA